MRSALLLLPLCSFLGASAAAQDEPMPLDVALRTALAEQARADGQTARLEKAAAGAQNEAERLHVQQQAAAQSIEAAEARISAANLRLQLATTYIAEHQRRLVSEQQPVSALLAGLATMARRPPLLALANRGGTDEMVKVRVLLDATLPVIRRKTKTLSAQMSEGQRLQKAALTARTEFARSRDNLSKRQQTYAALERLAVRRALASQGQALGSGDLSLATAEEVERLRDEQSSGQSIRAVAAKLAAEEQPAPISPFPIEGDSIAPAFAYRLPTGASVVEGLAAVSASGVRSRGLRLATQAGSAVLAPADGVVRFAGPFRDYDGVIIIDHGNGWLSLIVNAVSELHSGDRVRLGDPIGRALGQLQVELSHNGRRISPALIAGSSQSLSKGLKGG